MVKKSLYVGVLLGALALIGPAHAKNESSTSREWEELVKAAQKEGEVSVILSSTSGLREAMPAFEKKYGIKVNYQTGSGRKHAERVLAERRLGRYTVDVWMAGANTPLSKLIPNGVLAPVDELLIDPEVTDTSNWFQGKHHYTDPERRYIFTWGAAPTQNIVINTNMVKPEQIKSFWDLLDPKWKGKIVSWSPGNQGSGASVVPLVLNPKIGYEWFHRWANEMDVTLVSDARQGAEWVAMGRFPVGMFGLGTAADNLAEQGFPIQGWMPHPMKEGEILSSSWANIMSIDRAPHPNAMKLFINWALTREAQQLFIEVGQRKDSLRTDVDSNAIAAQYRIPRDGDYMIGWDNPDYATKQTEVLEELKKIMQEAGYQ
jgi:iron(III) transport system substrate-binding protein